MKLTVIRKQLWLEKIWEMFIIGPTWIIFSQFKLVWSAWEMFGWVTMWWGVILNEWINEWSMGGSISISSQDIGHYFEVYSISTRYCDWFTMCCMMIYRLISFMFVQILLLLSVVYWQVLTFNQFTQVDVKFYY